ncbi:MAG TPA: PLAT/LH2 domain-containing protein, partial [Longimicrobium sp.]
SNCKPCSKGHQDCVMDRNSRRLCPWTRGHIGWGHLFVELTTSSDGLSGTDDDVELDIGDRTWNLDTNGHDDREGGNRDGYALWAPELTLGDIRRILVRKSPDGVFGGWKLKRVRVFFGGSVVCDHDGIEQWLEDDDRVWVGCVTDPQLVNSLTLKVTTADVWWAGTDDDVTLTLAGRSWNLDTSGNDFERGNTDTFHLDPGTGLRVGDIHSIQLHKSPDGVAGGWRLGGVELIVNGGTIYHNGSINRWLEDDHRTWSDTV